MKRDEEGTSEKVAVDRWMTEDQLGGVSIPVNTLMSQRGAGSHFTFPVFIAAEIHVALHLPLSLTNILSGL